MRGGSASECGAGPAGAAAAGAGADAGRGRAAGLLLAAEGAPARDVRTAATGRATWSSAKAASPQSAPWPSGPSGSSCCPAGQAGTALRPSATPWPPRSPPCPQHWPAPSPGTRAREGAGTPSSPWPPGSRSTSPSSLSRAARIRRGHQRAAPPVHAQRHRPVPPRRQSHRRHRRQPAPHDPLLDDIIRETRRAHCAHRLKPPCSIDPLSSQTRVIGFVAIAAKGG